MSDAGTHDDTMNGRGAEQSAEDLAIENLIERGARRAFESLRAELPDIPDSGNGGGSKGGSSWPLRIIATVLSLVLAGGTPAVLELMKNAEALSQMPEVVNNNTEAIRVLNESRTEDRREMRQFRTAVAGERNDLTGELIKPGLIHAVRELTERMTHIESSTEAVRAHVVPNPPVTTTPRRDP